MAQGVEEQIGTFPAIKPELHLFEIGREMLRAESVPCSSKAAFEEREGGLDGIGVNVSDDVAASAVIDRLVTVRFAEALHGEFVRYVVIGIDHIYVLADILTNKLGECSRLRILSVKEPQITVALADTDHYFFVIQASDFAFAAIPSAKVRNVNFDLAIQHRLVGLRHCVTDTMAEIPCRLVAADAERALNLAGRNTLFRFAEEQRSGKPLHKGQVGIIEHGASGDAELVIAVFAVEELFFGFEFDYGSIAAEAARTFGPAQTDKQFPALLFGREHRIDIH